MFRWAMWPMGFLSQYHCIYLQQSFSLHSFASFTIVYWILYVWDWKMGSGWPSSSYLFEFCTVPTRSNLSPNQTPKSSLVCFASAWGQLFSKFASALRPLGIIVGYPRTASNRVFYLSFILISKRRNHPWV